MTGEAELDSVIRDTYEDEEKRVTYDLHRQMQGATRLKTSEFASAIVENLSKPRRSPG